MWNSNWLNYFNLFSCQTWCFTVKFQQFSVSGERSITFNSDKFNHLLQPICPFGPFNDPGNPLISILNLQVFIFNDMKDGDELTMFVTVFGCIHYEDCFPVSLLISLNIPVPPLVIFFITHSFLKYIMIFQTRSTITNRQYQFHSENVKCTSFFILMFLVEGIRDGSWSIL